MYKLNSVQNATNKTNNIKLEAFLVGYSYTRWNNL